MKDLDGHGIHAADRDIGKVTNFYFDEDTWAIRYFVVDTGNGLASRNVLISPISIGRPNWVENILPASITKHKQQVQDSPLSTRRNRSHTNTK
ncbi:MAG: PRC-barrel domain-containing protein [Amphritea sp.]|nr:PRC-barrel domain-containing protein [Amphritea sp.]